MNRLHYASSEHDADMLFAAGFLVPDPFLYFENRGRSHIVLSQLEYDRGVKQAKVDRVLSLSEITSSMRKMQGRRILAHEWIREVLRKHGVRRVSVSREFPLGLADGLRRGGIRLDVAEEGLFPERMQKSQDQLKDIRRSLTVTGELLECAMDFIRSARIRKDARLSHGKTFLTSERVQALIRMEAAKRGFEASHPIVAGGRQACDPHERGHGVLRARELIILDIFPRNLATGYWGDMTRTVLKGRASEAQRRLFTTVHEAQRIAFSKLGGGRDGQTAHRSVEEHFLSRGYRTGNDSGRWEGFFHGTGHGLGLDIHEGPRVSAVSQKLRPGNVVTVEPGLYYPAIGGVRIEDVAVIRASGAEWLSRFPVRLELP